MKAKFVGLLIIGLVSAPVTGYCSGWEFLFNGENLDGFETIGDPEWSVDDGVITVKGTGSEMGWLVTEKEYSDFILRLRFKWHGGNSGIQVRSHIDNGKMIGYQANLDWSREFATGSLLEENGRGMLQACKIPADELGEKGGWNEYEISCIGDHTVVTVNGEKVVDLKDPEGAEKGIIALQMSPGENAALEWSDIRILEIPGQQDWTSLFNGKDMKQWWELGDAMWKVGDGFILGESENGGFGWLVSKNEYKDFHFSTRFKMSSGNSGIQFRSWPVQNMIHGFQADIAFGSDWINGHLYDQSEEGVLVRPKQDFSKVIDWQGWNTYEITAIGPKVELFINGIKSIEHNDPERDLKGVFAFQIHAGPEMETYWKDIRVIDLK